MPFPLVLGLPSMSEDEMNKLRRDIVQLLSDMIPNCPKHYLRPVFVEDMLTIPTGPDDGSNTIFVYLITGMFGKGKEANKLAPKVTRAVSELIARAFNHTIEVECGVGELNSEWTSLVPVRK